VAHTKTAARKLTTKAEMALLETSFPPALKDITPGRLKQKISRSRKLQDKYRDLAQQQRGEARGKRKAKSTRPAKGNDNTVTKQEIFSEALARFEAQLEKLEAKAAKELARKEKAAAKVAAKAAKAAKTTVKKAAKKTAKKTGTAVKRAARKATTTARKAVSSASRGVRKAAKVARSGNTKHQGHVSSRGRRRQAKRDSR
jgi:hypothetical protein